MRAMYKTFLKPILFVFSPEFIHNLFVSLGEFLGRFSAGRALTGLVYDYRGKDISKTIDGIHYRTPVLLSAGFDYNGRLSQILPFVGFGGEEVGSVTARACQGNPRPRLTRLPKSQSIIVNKGLLNDGVDAIISRLKKREQFKNFVVGISIAKTNDRQSAEESEGINDYAYSLKRLTEENVGDYYTINISCPNAFGGEPFTEPKSLERLLARLKSVPCNKPIYIKMPINLPWNKFEELLQVIINYGFQGVVIGNLNKDYNSPALKDELPEKFRGGLSGKPCFELSNKLIRKTRMAYGNRLTIIGVGGIFSPEDALQKMEAGADLVQLITGMIYEGPGLIKRICKKVADK